MVADAVERQLELREGCGNMLMIMLNITMIVYMAMAQLDAQVTPPPPLPLCISLTSSLRPSAGAVQMLYYTTEAMESLISNSGSGMGLDTLSLSEIATEQEFFLWLRTGERNGDRVVTLR
jgi:hypothetical protein